MGWLRHGANPVKVNKELARERGIDIDEPTLGLRVAAERLSTVRYVFIVQIEEGIPSASQRAALEFADAVLIGWPDDEQQIETIDVEQQQRVMHEITVMEDYIAQFSSLEREADINGMTDCVVRICECVAEIRKVYQPSFPLPTFAEIHRVVQDEWNEDMGRIDADEATPTAASIEHETERADQMQGQSDENADEKADEAGDDAGDDAPAEPGQATLSPRSTQTSAITDHDDGAAA